MTAKEDIQEIGSTEFKKLISSETEKIVIVDFYAEWCMPCIMMSPVLESIAENNKKVKIVKINIDDEQGLAREYQVSSIPCIIFFKKSNELDRIVGSVDEETINEKINSLLK